MKKLFIAVLLLIGVASFAQETTDQKPTRERREKLTPEQRNDKHLQKLTTDLNLDANQQAQVKQLLADRTAKAEKFREDRKNSTTKPTAAEKEAFKKQMMAEKDANDAKMKSILNADQYKKWTSIQEENKDKAKERMKEYRKDKN
ncbi:hypothetical protein [Flavobacterium chilense]|uniref:LTXXQ motif family protein n=1 Tax=Flavobacterium chilense TaxID=946677 RepID=A0A1M7M3G8_9FLAO|nr:hypothetical protein [Flavobacterium chilense]SHM85223.1 hypothetical protein SAMN05444484_11150 [Flavobacterium chilense]